MKNNRLSAARGIFRLVENRFYLYAAGIEELYVNLSQAKSDLTHLWEIINKTQFELFPSYKHFLHRACIS